MPLCAAEIDPGIVAPPCFLAGIQHMQEHDFTVEGLGKAIRQLKDFQWTLRQIDRQQEPVGLYAKMLTRQFQFWYIHGQQ